MDIPDESPWGPVPDIVRVEFVDSGEITPELTVGLLADIKQVQRERDADIARAAQVQVLREMAERYSKAAGLENAAEDYDERCHDRLLWMATQLGIEADALEQESP